MAVSTRLKTAVFAPMPRARMAMATRLNPGALSRVRAANLRSDHILTNTRPAPRSSQKLAVQGRYNRVVRISAVLFLSLALVACNSAKKNDDAVRQGVIDYL